MNSKCDSGDNGSGSISPCNRDGSESNVADKFAQDFTGRHSPLWDDEIDAGIAKPKPRSRTGWPLLTMRFTVRAGLWLVPLLFAVILIVELPAEIRFRSNVSAMNRRAGRLGGAVFHGRRAFQHRVSVWFHGKDISDDSMAEIVSIVRECQSRGLRGEHLSLDLSGTRVGDDGIKLLVGVSVLQTVSIRDTNVTEEGSDLLRRSLPNTLIDDGPMFPHETND